MKSRHEIMPILKDYANAVKSVYGALLEKIILYGSYAREDYNEDSDIDILILLNVPPAEERKELDALAGITSDFNIAHDLYILPMMKSTETFSKWARVDPFYQNVSKEGMVLLGA